MATTIQQIELPKKARAVDTSGNNNHGQIYSGRGLEFDGIGDNLNINGFTLEGTKATVAFWINTATTIGYVMDLNSTIRFVIGFNNDNLKFYDGNGWKTFGTIATNVYLRCVVVLDGTVAKCFVNGHQLGADVTIQNISIASNTAAAIGFSTTGGGAYITAKLSDFQVWDTAWSAADVTYDYLNPESLALNNSGTALTESNLKLWYPMQDGHRGQQSYILDGSNTGAVSEKIVDGSFANDLDDWAKYGVTSATGGVATIGASSNSGIYQTILTQGVGYTVTINVVSVNATGTSEVTNGNGNNLYTITETGIQTFTFISAIASGQLIVRGMSNALFSVSSISVKAINDKNHATTVFYGDELVTNGTFDAKSGWNVLRSDYNVTTNADKATITNSDVNGYIYNTTAITTVVGRSYNVKVNYYGTLSTIGGANPQVKYDNVGGGGSVYGTSTIASADADELIDFSFIATNTVFWVSLFTATSGDVHVWDNVSVKEVGVASGWTDADQQLHIPQTALQSYNELAWFDGTSASNGYVDLDTEIATANNDWSLSFWVYKLDTGAAYNFIFAANASTKNISLDNNGNERLSYRATGNAYHVLSDAALPHGEWIHVVITANADTSMTAYINGVAQTTNSDMSDTELVLSRFMNGYSNDSYNVLGTVNEISYYSDVLTSAEALDLFNDGKAKSALELSGSAELVGYWRNNGLSEWKDLKGSNDGNTSAGVVETILIPQGVDSTRDAQGFIMNRQKSTSCLNLTWPMYAEINDSDTLDFGTGDFSIECWVKHGYRHTGSAVNTVIALGGDAASASASIISTATVFRFYVGSALVNSTVTLVKDNWYHVVGTRTGTTVRLYVDGAVESGTATSSQNLTNSLSKYVGRDSGSARDYKEAVDGVRLYADALSAGEVLRNYNATKGNHRN